MLLPRYDRQGASSRLRSYQFIPELAARGIEVDAYPLLPNEYLAKLYQHGKRDFVRAVTAYVKRLQLALRGSEHHVLWVEKEVFPWLPFFMEKWVVGKRPPLLLDYDDAIFHNYDLSKSRAVRTFLSGKIDHLMRAAAIVTVGNSYLASRAAQAGAGESSTCRRWLIFAGTWGESPSTPKDAMLDGSARPKQLHTCTWYGQPWQRSARDTG